MPIRVQLDGSTWLRSFELNMTENAVERVYTKEELIMATADKVDLWLGFEALGDPDCECITTDMSGRCTHCLSTPEDRENGRGDGGLDGWFQPEGPLGFRIAEPNTIIRIHGYNMGWKQDLLNDATYLNLTQDKKDLIPEDKSLFLVVGELTTGEVVHTHWTLESSRFAQKVTCDWWDAAEEEILYSWGVGYDDIVD